MKNSLKPKILFITPYFPPHVGGLELYAYNIATGFAKRHGWNVIVVTTNHTKRMKAVETKNGIKIYRLPIWFKISNTPFNLLWYFKIKKIIKHEKPDIINAHSPVPYIADMAALASGDIPFIITYHAGTMKKSNHFLDIPIKLYESHILPLTISKASAIICVSNFVKKTVFLHAQKKSIVIHPGVDTTMFKPGNHKRVKNSVLFIGHSPNMYRAKGLYLLIKELESLPFATLRVIGKKIKLNTQNVTFLGIKRGKALVKQLQKTSVLVLCPPNHSESFGMVLIEAMACKTPVIGTKVGGIPEIIKHKKNGLLVSPTKNKSLLKAVQNILLNDSLSKKMSNNGYNMVKKHFTWQHQIDKTHMVFASYLLKIK